MLTKRGFITVKTWSACGILAVFLLALGPTVSEAANLYWSGNATLLGGSGTWDTGSTFWNASGTQLGGNLTNQAWSNTATGNDTAIFAGQFSMNGSTNNSTILLGANITAGALTFNVGGYVIQPGTGLFTRLFAAEVAPGGTVGRAWAAGAPIDGFYRKLGWKTVTNQHASLNDKGERILSDPKGTGISMIYPGRRPLEQWPDGLVDLNGRDW